MTPRDNLRERPLLPIRLRNYRIEFYGQNLDERTAAAVPFKCLGYVDLVLNEHQRKDLTGIAFRQVKPKCLSATRIKIFER